MSDVCTLDAETTAKLRRLLVQWETLAPMFETIPPIGNNALLKLSQVEKEIIATVLRAVPKGPTT